MLLRRHLVSMCSSATSRCAGALACDAAGSRQSSGAGASTSGSCAAESSAAQQGRHHHVWHASSSRGRPLCTAAAAPAAAPPAAAVPEGAAPASATASFASLDKREAAKFAALADEWWSPTGPFAPLLALNPARCAFIRQAATAPGPGAPPAAGRDAAAEPLAGLTAVDVGCGGGLLSEPLARLGAQVHGIDVSDENVMAAAAHAAGDPLLASRTRYERTSAEALADTGARYSLVVASEVIEHVNQPADFVKVLASLMAPGGRLVVSTLNRTPRSYAMAIAAAEHVLGVVPPGTHDWVRFITPDELAMMAADAGLRMHLVAGMLLNPLTGRWGLGEDLGVNYIASFVRA